MVKISMKNSERCTNLAKTSMNHVALLSKITSERKLRSYSHSRSARPNRRKKKKRLQLVNMNMTVHQAYFQHLAVLRLPPSQALLLKVNINQNAAIWQQKEKIELR